MLARSLLFWWGEKKVTDQQLLSARLRTIMRTLAPGLVWTAALAGLLGTLLVASGPVEAQEESLPKSVIRSGYVQMGNPPDTRTDQGGIHRTAFEAQYKGFGGTVYYMVLQRGSDAKDPWGLGAQDLSELFVPGSGAESAKSPALDNKAKYLYLYQIVNDRG